MTSEEVVRGLIAKTCELRVDPKSLSNDASLYTAGLTSFASVQLMLALEQAFDIEFPRPAAEPQNLRLDTQHQRRGRRSLFGTGRGMNSALRPQTALDLAARARRVAATARKCADSVDAENRFPNEAVAALKAERPARRADPGGTRRRRPLADRDRGSLRHSRPGLLLHRHDLRHAHDQAVELRAARAGP